MWLRAAGLIGSFLDSGGTLSGDQVEPCVLHSYRLQVLRPAGEPDCTGSRQILCKINRENALRFRGRAAGSTRMATTNQNSDNQRGVRSRAGRIGNTRAKPQSSKLGVLTAAAEEGSPSGGVGSPTWTRDTAVDLSQQALG